MRCVFFGTGPFVAAYADCDLNAKTAAQRLHLRVNTAYYRLEKIVWIAPSAARCS